MNSIGRQWLANGSYLTKMTAFSPGTCLNTDTVSSVNRTISVNKNNNKQNSLEKEKRKSKFEVNSRSRDN